MFMLGIYIYLFAFQSLSVHVYTLKYIYFMSSIYIFGGGKLCLVILNIKNKMFILFLISIFILLGNRDYSFHNTFIILKRVQINKYKKKQLTRLYIRRNKTKMYGSIKFIKLGIFFPHT